MTKSSNGSIPAGLTLYTFYPSCDMAAYADPISMSFMCDGDAVRYARDVESSEVVNVVTGEVIYGDTEL